MPTVFPVVGAQLPGWRKLTIGPILLNQAFKIEHGWIIGRSGGCDAGRYGI